MIYISSPGAKKPIQQPVMRSKNIEMEYLKYSTLPNVQKRPLKLDHSLDSRNDRSRTSSLPRSSGSQHKATAIELREKARKAAKQAAAASSQNEQMHPSNITDGYFEDVNYLQIF